MTFGDNGKNSLEHTMLSMTDSTFLKLVNDSRGNA